MRWIDTRFDSTYAAYLLRNPGAALIDPFPTALEERMWTPGHGVVALSFAVADVAFFLVVTGLLVTWALVRRARIRNWRVGALLIANAAISTIVTWDAGAGIGDYERVFLPPAVSVRLGMLILIVYALEALSGSSRRRRCPVERPA